MGSSVGGSGGSEVDGERSDARRAVCFPANGGACFVGRAMVRGRVVDSASEPGSSIRWRLCGFAPAAGADIVVPFFSHGRVLGIITVESLNGVERLNDRKASRECGGLAKILIDNALGGSSDSLSYC